MLAKKVDLKMHREKLLPDKDNFLGKRWGNGGRKVRQSSDASEAIVRQSWDASGAMEGPEGEGQKDLNGLTEWVRERR